MSIMGGLIVAGGLVLMAGLLAAAIVSAADEDHERADELDHFVCQGCGSGIWHDSWSDDDPRICPNCSGAD